MSVTSQGKTYTNTFPLAKRWIPVGYPLEVLEKALEVLENPLGVLRKAIGKLWKNKLATNKSNNECVFVQDWVGLLWCTLMIGSLVFGCNWFGGKYFRDPFKISFWGFILSIWKCPLCAAIAIIIIFIHFLCCSKFAIGWLRMSSNYYSHQLIYIMFRRRRRKKGYSSPVEMKDGRGV